MIWLVFDLRGRKGKVRFQEHIPSYWRRYHLLILYLLQKSLLFRLNFWRILCLHTLDLEVFIILSNFLSNFYFVFTEFKFIRCWIILPSKFLLNHIGLLYQTSFWSTSQKLEFKSRVSIFMLALYWYWLNQPTFL